MTIKLDDNTDIPIGNATGKRGGAMAVARDFERYMAAVEEYIRSTRKPTTGRDKDKVG